MLHNIANVNKSRIIKNGYSIPNGTNKKNFVLHL